ncbi:MAG: PEP-CTERM-box response regulator transcription factor [Thermodesulfobacteriota bacterium]|nr:PEP-CTERM-box response regulator transcription factor [Thermodesulfobacteriota bacterium]
MSLKKLLIIEDEASVAKQLKWGLGKHYDITIASNVDQARPLLASGAFPVATLDLGLPPYPDTTREGFALLEESRGLGKTKIIVITGNAEDENAVRAIGMGAADFCSKPIDLSLLNIILSRTFRIYELEESNRALQRQSAQSFEFCGMLGVSPVMTEIFELIRKISGNDYPVLISGESGTGKEMVAHALHELSGRSDYPFVIINCGAIPENLLESELFGYEKGAFTGASSRKIGKFEQADKGTIFLDEIGELPLALQVKLLRCLQEGTIERVGGARAISLSIRILAATNIDLQDAVAQGGFRKDLFFRLNVVPIQIPPLRERSEDILVLANHFLREESKILGRGRVSFSPSARACLPAHSWPGNVRELQNCVRRALSVTSDTIINSVDLGFDEPDRVENDLQTLKTARENAEIKAVRQALAMTGNNISQAAKLLEVSRPTLHDLIKKTQNISFIRVMDQ